VLPSYPRSRQRQAARLGRAGEKRCGVEATLDHRTVDAERCRQLAKSLQLDAIGVLHRDDGGRTLTWWTSPEAPALPLDVDMILDGRADGWVVAPAGERDVVVARLTARSAGHTPAALRSLLAEESMVEAGWGLGDDEELDDDRARWAYAIHDGLTQVVTAAVLDLEWRARQVADDPEGAQQVLTDAAAELRSALGEIRSILTIVTPDDDQVGETASLDRIVEQASRRWRVPASWSLDGDLDQMPAPVMDAATSVIREGVANAAKHSATRRIAVRVEARPTEMRVSVEDSGRGFRPQEAASSGHLGLAMIRRRVEELHGTLDIESEPGRGTRVVARLPVEQGDTS
jgi:signal transduction histidine kinase